MMFICTSGGEKVHNLAGARKNKVNFSGPSNRKKNTTVIRANMQNVAYAA